MWRLLSVQPYIFFVQNFRWIISSVFVIRNLINIKIYNQILESLAKLYHTVENVTAIRITCSLLVIMFCFSCACCFLPQGWKEGQRFLINLMSVCKKLVIKCDWSRMEASFNTFIYCMRVPILRSSNNSIIANNNNVHIISEWPEGCISCSFICHKHTFYWALQTFLYTLVVIFYIVTC